MSQGVPSSSPGPKATIGVTSGSAGGDTTYISGVHFTVTRISATVLEFAGLGFDPVPNLFIGVSDFNSANLFTKEYTPRTNVFSWNSGTSRLTVADATFSASGSWYISLLGPDRFASYPDNHKLTAITNQYPLNASDRGIPLIASAQTLTASWADLGPEIACFGFNALKLWLTNDINLSNDIRIRILEKHESGGTEEYNNAIETIGASNVKIEPHYWEDNTDVDKLITVVFALDGLTPYAQPQAMVGTAGGTPADIDAAYYTLGWR